MTDLERKLADALRGQAEEVTPNLDAAWAEQQRRQRRPQRRRRASVWIAPLAAVLVVLTSVLVATQLNTAAPVPAPPAGAGDSRIVLPTPEHPSMASIKVLGDPVRLATFAGQTDAWTSLAFDAVPHDGLWQDFFCIAAVPAGQNLGEDSPQYGTKSPLCMQMNTTPSPPVIMAGHVGNRDDPLPAGKAVYAVQPDVRELRLFDAKGDLVQARKVGSIQGPLVFLADLGPEFTPVRYQVTTGTAVLSGDFG
jgi:hypothetical protein